GAWDGVAAKDVASDTQLWVEHGKPLLFGKNRDKGLRIIDGGQRVEVVTVGEGGVPESEIVVHDETNRTLAFLLAHLSFPDMPMAFGVLYRDPRSSYGDAVAAQNDRAMAQGAGDI